MSTATLEIAEVDYPESDGEPMAETGVHVRAMLLLRQALEDFYRDRRDVFVSTNQNWYWNEGDTGECLAPDVFVAIGVPDRPLSERGCFKAWEENRVVPAVVFEMASKSTWRDDLGKKYRKYSELGVREYFIFDPLGQYLVPRLQGFRLEGRIYQRLIPDGNDVFESELGFRLTGEHEMLRLIDATTGRLVLTKDEKLEEAEAKLAKLQALLAQHNIPNGNGS